MKKILFIAMCAVCCLQATGQVTVNSTYYSTTSTPTSRTTKADYSSVGIDELLRKANNGDADAQCELGDRYWKGYGVESDEAESLKWHRKAANQGNAASQYMLGMCYEEGWVVNQSYTEAVKWYKKSANQGFTSGLYSLGICYKEGKGVTKDRNEAIKCFRRLATSKERLWSDAAKDELQKLGASY